MRPFPATAIALALATSAPAPAADIPAAGAPMFCAGGETLSPLLRAWAEAAAAEDPRTRVDVAPDAALSAEGMRLLLDGRANCVSMVREPFPSELAAFRRQFGHAPLLVPVARGSFATRGGTHAIAVYVNAANPIRGLTLAQIEAAFSAAPRGRREGPARAWGDLGLSGPWRTRPLRVYGMIPRRASGDPPGVVNFVQRQVLGGGAFRDDLVVQVDRPGEQALATIVRKVAEDPEGIGYSGFGYAAPGARAVPLAIRPGAPFIAGSPASVADGAYPLARHIYILVDRAPGRPLDPAARRFLDFVLGPRGQAMIRRDAEGFFPLTPAEVSAARKELR